jgi:hypothetical protein
VEVEVRGQGTSNADLDAARLFTCSDLTCQGAWVLPLALDVGTPSELATPEASATAPLSVAWTIVAIARDTAGQESERLYCLVLWPPPE